MNIVKSAAIVLALAASLAVNAQPTTIKHKGLECTTCHVDGKLTPPDAKACLAWHSEESIAKAGERFNFESYFKDPRDGSEICKKVAINRMTASITVVPISASTAIANIVLAPSPAKSATTSTPER